MIELPFVFLAGILGTAHCLGMCGPLAIRLSTGSARWSHALVRQSLYSLGRLLTYVCLGLLAGFCGNWAKQHSASLMNVPAILAIVAGAVFIYQGFQETGLMGMIRRSLTRVLGSSTKSDKLTAASASCGAGLLFAPFFRGQGHTGALIAGVCTGFLPCGLLYGMLTLAASTHHVLWGGATMLAFGLGTLPLMVLVGTTGQLLSLVSRRYLFAAAAWCLILTGAISLGRGIGHLSWSDRPATGCPLCTAQQVAE